MLYSVFRAATTVNTNKLNPTLLIKYLSHETAKWGKCHHQIQSVQLADQANVVCGCMTIRKSDIIAANGIQRLKLGLQEPEERVKNRLSRAFTAAKGGGRAGVCANLLVAGTGLAEDVSSVRQRILPIIATREMVDHGQRTTFSKYVPIT